MQRVPCLHPNCDATLKNIKNFWKHRQSHIRTEEVASKTSKKIKQDEEDPSSNDDNDANSDIDHNHLDNQEDNLQIEPDTIMITAKETPEDAEEAEEDPVSFGDPNEEDSGNLQDNHDDNDWLPSGEEEEAEEDTETDLKPDITSNVTEDPSCTSTIIKGGTRTTQQCPRCPLKFNSISSTLRHLSSTHKLKKLPCLHPGCTSALASIKAYFRHRKRHLYPPKPIVPRKPYKKREDVNQGPCLCDMCGASFKKKYYLTRHKLVVHLKTLEEKRVPCHLCGITFRKGYLKKHILFMHKDEGQDQGVGVMLQCGVVGCKLFFLRKEGLDNHIMKKHGGDGGGGGGEDGDGNGRGEALKQFKCSFCGKGFCFKRKLDQHELSHRNQQLGIRPFVCELCGKGFGVPQNLKNHLNYTHKLAKRFQSKMDN